ncbi:VIT1/CCC1 transporter family protein [Roseomonas gilardii subsp. gilardii]|uniref:VIT1/CCC1 transporter family protein n=1 Tax=Roseomonas gilardii TaxID=257708 RepID=UPI001FF9F7B2|nr:VIT1/CCC1 transporter family protein [Roseomonas gilardii]UPG71248.1 VIT1/CCC1 transporter family protein [Roseomonas gilardii subsp. gilardii]
MSDDGLPVPPPGPSPPEAHATSSPLVRDLVIGTADGLTVPFALAAGLSGAVAANPLIVTAGLAEIAAGCIAMGLGGYLAARSEADRYATEYRREWAETDEYPERERWEVAAILHRYGLRGETLRKATAAICADRTRWVDFMMRAELELNEPEAGEAPRSALRIGGSYVMGGLVPLLPYMLLDDTRASLAVSCAVTGLALLAFGWLKARATGMPRLSGAVQTAAIGAAAAGAAFGIARLAGG